MATIQNYVIDAGSNFESIIDVEAQSNVSWNIANYDVRGAIKKSHGSLANSAVFTASLDANNSTVTISLEPADTRDLKGGLYVYDIELFTEDETRAYRILEGTVSIRPAVTKPPVANTP